MSVSFRGLGLNNGLASRLLGAIGYPVGESSAGSMRVDEMLTGIEAAKSKVTSDDAPYLRMLEKVVLQVQEDGDEVLEWW